MESQPERFESQLMPLEKLKPHPRNYRKHPPDQLAHLQHSLRRVGFYKNVVCAKDLTILAGHGITEAARAIGMTEAPVVVLDIGPNDPIALKLVASDNETQKLAETDDRALTELLKEVRQLDPDGLLGSGFDDKQLAALVLVSRHQSEIQNESEAAHWVGMPTFGVKQDNPKLTVLFRNKEDRQKFVETFSLKALYRSDAIWTVWWPEKDQNDLASVKFITAPQEPPKDA